MDNRPRPHSTATRAEGILAAVRFAANRFLRAKDWRDEIDTVLTQLGHASNTCRVGLYLTQSDCDNPNTVTLTHEWVRDDAYRLMGHEDLHRFDMQATGFEDWQKSFEAGQSIAGIDSDFSADQQAVLAKLSIASVANAPVIVRGRWRGVLAFNNCIAKREWTQAEIDALAAAADTLSAAIERFEVDRDTRAQQSQYADLIDSLPLGLMRSRLTDPPEFVVVNSAAAKLYGYESVEQLLQTSPLDTYLDPADRQRLLERFRKEGAFTGEELLGRRRDGSGVWVSISWRLGVDPTDQSQYIDATVEDITARKEAEAALRESEHRYRGLVESQTDLIVRVDPEGRFTFINDAYCKTFNKTREELIGSTFMPLVHPDDLPTTLAEMEKLSQPPYRVTIRQRAMTAEGWRWLEWEDYAIHDEHGQLIEIQAVGRNINDRMQAERQLREERSLLKTIVDTMPTGIYVKDADGRYVMANRRFVELAAVPLNENELVGKTVEEVSPPDKAKQYREADEKIMRTGQARLNHEGQHPNRDGENIWTLNTVVPLTDSDGSCTGLVGFLHDISTVKRAQLRLRSERQLLQTVINSSPSGAYLKDTKGRFLFANQKFIDLTYIDATPADLIGKTDLDVFDQDRAHRFRSNDRQTLEDGRAIEHPEFCHTDAGGHPLWTINTVGPFHDHDGSVGGIVGFITDVTALKQVEIDLRNERALLRTIIDSLPDGAYLMDRQGRFQVVNQNFIDKMPGENAESYYIGTTYADHFAKDCAEEFTRRDRQVMESGETLFIPERHFLNWSGEPIWQQVTITPYRNSAGEILGVMGLVRDITRQKLAEQSVQEERNLLRTVIDAIPAAVYLKDSEGRHLLVNEHFVAARGHERTAEEYIGKTDFELFEHERAERWRKQDEQVLAGQSLLRTTTFAVSRLGEANWMLINKVPIRDRNDNIVGLTGVVMNVTEQKRNEENLRAERRLLRTVIDTIPSALYFKDREGRYQLANKAFYEGHGLQTEEGIVGKTDFDLYTPEKAEYCQVKDAEMLRTGERVLNKEVERKGEHGSTWTLFNSAPVPDGAGGYLGLIGIVESITEKKRAERAIAESEEKFRTLSEQSLLSVAIIQDGKLNYVNDAFCSLTGFDREEVANWNARNYIQMVHPQDRELINRRTNTTLSDNEESSSSYEFRVFTKTGEMRWVEQYSKTIWSQGKPAVFVTFIDVTGRKRAEAAMRLNEARFHETLATSRDIVYRLNLQSLTYDYVGAAVEPLMGYSVEEFTEMGFAKVAKRFHPDDLAGLDRHFASLLNNNLRELTSPIIEYRWKRCDGEYRWFSDSRSIVYDQTGRAEAIVGAIRDITERKRVEEELRSSEAKYRELFETVPVGLLQTHPAGEGSILIANPAAARIFGFDSIDDFRQWNISKLFPSEKHRQRLLHMLTTKGQVYQKELRTIRRDGKDLWLSLTANVVRDAKGDIRHIDSLFEDITEHKAAARAVQEAHSKLAAAREVERRRLATELHDSLGQSMVVLHLAIQSIYAGKADNLTDEQIDALRSTASRCAELIGEVRGICHGLFPRVLEALGLEAALRSLTRDCKGQLNADLHVPPHLEGCRFDDNIEIVLYRIAQEAVNNALRHSGAMHLDIELDYSDGNVGLSIADDGQGFDPDESSVVGLGLTTMRERAEAVGGELTIESEPSRTCIRIEVTADLHRRVDD